MSKDRPPCKVDGCGKPKNSHGLCAMHAARWRKYGDVGPVGHLPPRETPPTCRVEGCNKPKKKKSARCGMHTWRLYEWGEVGPVGVLPAKTPVPCGFESCNKQARALGYCNTHYERLRRTGDLGPEGDGRKRIPKLCVIEGCESKRASILGYCGKHLARYRLHGDPEKLVNNYAAYRSLMDTGYVRVWRPGHPLAKSDGYVLEHRLVAWENGLLVSVDSELHVHHKNRDKTDNRIENLEVVLASEHKRQHLEEDGFVTNQFGVWPLRNL